MRACSYSHLCHQCTYVCVYGSMYLHTYVHADVCINAYMSVCAYVYICMCVNNLLPYSVIIHCTKGSDYMSIPISHLIYSSLHRPFFLYVLTHLITYYIAIVLFVGICQHYHPKRSTVRLIELFQLPCTHVWACICFFSVLSSTGIYNHIHLFHRKTYLSTLFYVISSTDR